MHSNGTSTTLLGSLFQQASKFPLLYYNKLELTAIAGEIWKPLKIEVVSIQHLGDLIYMLLLELLMLTSHFWVHYNLSRFSDSQMTCFHISATIRPSTPGPTISRSLCPTLSNERAPIPMASDIPMITQRRKMNNHTKTKRDSVNRVNFARSNFPERMKKKQI